MPQNFLDLSRKQVETLFRGWCYSRLYKPEASDSLIQRLESKPLPPEEFWCLHQKHGLMNPRGNKGTKYKLSEKTCLCWEAGTVSGLEWTQFQTGSKQGCRPPHCVEKLIFHFTFNVILVEMFVWFNMRIKYRNGTLLFHSLNWMHTISTGITWKETFWLWYNI